MDQIKLAFPQHAALWQLVTNIHSKYSRACQKTSFFNSNTKLPNGSVGDNSSSSADLDAESEKPESPREVIELAEMAPSWIDALKMFKSREEVASRTQLERLKFHNLKYRNINKKLAENNKLTDEANRNLTAQVKNLTDIQEILQQQLDDICDEPSHEGMANGDQVMTMSTNNALQAIKNAIASTEEPPTSVLDPKQESPDTQTLDTLFDSSTLTAELAVPKFDDSESAASNAMSKIAELLAGANNNNNSTIDDTSLSSSLNQSLNPSLAISNLPGLNDQNTPSKRVPRREFCVTCQKEVASLKQHINYVHNDARPFKCEKCPAAFKSRSGLLRHNRGVKCDEGDSAARDLKRKRAITNSSQNKTAKIENEENDGLLGFGGTFESLAALQEKLLGQPDTTTSPVNSVENNLISTKQSSKTSYNLHMPTTNGKVVYNLEAIPPSEIVLYTIDKSTIRTHGQATVLNPDGEPMVTERPKPYCKICRKVHGDRSCFDTLADLRAHERVEHNNYQLYSCNLCHYLTKERGALVNHLFGHPELQGTSFVDESGMIAEDKIMEHARHGTSVTCQKCSETFDTYWDLQDHIESQHIPKWRFFCLICGAGYKAKCGSVDRHILSVHKSIPNEFVNSYIWTGEIQR